MFNARVWRNFDWWLFALAALLVSVGLIVLYSLGFKAEGVTVPVDVRNQIIFTILGAGALFGAALTDYRVWGKFSRWLYGIMLVLLGWVSVRGHSALGATRWINLGFFQFQPSELSKIVVIIVLAKFLSSHYDEMDRPKNLVLSLVYVLIPAGLVLIQPDLGTAIVYAVIWTVMVLVSRVKASHFLALLGIGAAMIPVAIKVMKPYQRARLATFLNPTADPLRGGYNVLQATIAVGSGQLKGRGLGAGTQSQLNFLPSQHTDFIFAVVAEKLGFIGGMLLLILFGLLFLRAFQIAAKAQDRFGMLMAVGIASMLLIHVFINIGMNLGMLPVTGIPLPFVSYGGTSLIVGLISIGLLESIAIRHRKIQFGR